MNKNQRSSVTLKLGESMIWRLLPLDDGAEEIVAELAFAMKLSPSRDETGLLLKVRTDPSVTSSLMPKIPPDEGTIDCVLLPSEKENNDLLITQVNHLALIVLRLAQLQGAVLLHGAMARLRDPKEKNDPGKGIILAGPGTVGKSTASSRLPPPWEALCDDATLVVPDGKEGFLAQPWPTWSLFYSNGPKGQWDIQDQTPLEAIFFLSQAPKDSVSPMNRAEGTALLMESIQQVAGGMTRRMDRQRKEQVYLEQLSSVTRLAQGVFAHHLDICLTGEFWKDIEPLLSTNPEKGDRVNEPKTHKNDGEPPLKLSAMLKEGSPELVKYTGPSMNPTLAEPDLLEVVPYDGNPILKGDVIYYQKPGDSLMVVHRVICTGPEGIRTRGDNNREIDSYVLEPSLVEGKVVAAQRRDKRRDIAGGWYGTLQERWRHFAISPGPRRFRSRVTRGLATIYNNLGRTGLFCRISAGKQPKVVLFQVRQQKFLKLLVDGRAVGNYDLKKKHWRIKPPFRLFVDGSKLPVVAQARDLKTRSKASRALKKDL